MVTSPFNCQPAKSVGRVGVVESDFGERSGVEVFAGVGVSAAKTAVETEIRRIKRRKYFIRKGHTRTTYLDYWEGQKVSSVGERLRERRARAPVAPTADPARLLFPA